MAHPSPLGGSCSRLAFRAASDANRNMNSIGVIAPYKYEGMWVFDDPCGRSCPRAFRAGIDMMIDMLVASIPNAEKGFDGAHLNFWKGQNLRHEGRVGSID